MRGVTSARASISPRAVAMTTQSPLTTPTSRASSGEISANSSGCSSARCDSVRDMPPAVWCSVKRYVVRMCGKRWSGEFAYGLSGRSIAFAAGLRSCDG